MLEDEVTRQYHRCQFPIAKLLEQTKYVSINRLLPDLIAVTKVAADANRMDARIDCAGIQSKHATLSIAENADSRIFAAVFREPIDCSKYLLHLIADEVPTQLEC